MRPPEMSEEKASLTNDHVSPKPILSVIVELGTREVTQRLPLVESVLRPATAAEGLNAGDVELIFVGEHALPAEMCSDHVRTIAAPETGYYGWKNLGAAAARGDYLVFWDSDCRPAPGYLRRVIALFDADPELAGVAGRSVYDGTSFVTRLNTVLSFGYLAQPMETLQRDVALSHNVAIRRDMFPKAPFGPFAGRVGGDAFLTNWARQAGRPLKLDPALLIFHENPSASLTALMERHLRELFIPLLQEPASSRSGALRVGWRSLPRLLVRRPVRLMRWGRFCGFTKLDVAASMPVLALYLLLDACAMLVLTLRPPLLTRWLRYQFGDSV
jgi:glycosyltransferase involved in cell wall biosynthesis